MAEGSLQELIELAKSLEEENRKFYGGNNAAGTRLRKGLQEIKKKSQAMRNEITATKAERKD
ncbi:MAG: histone H1 [Deltaproteobacteria bacterium]|nr:histone H1 [Deltaproteobacteria bacterium]